MTDLARTGWRSTPVAKFTLAEWQPALPVPDGTAEIAVYFLGGTLYVKDSLAVFGCEKASSLVLETLRQAYTQATPLHAMAYKNRYDSQHLALACRIVGLATPDEILGLCLSVDTQPLRVTLETVQQDPIVYKGYLNFQ